MNTYCEICENTEDVTQYCELCGSMYCQYCASEQEAKCKNCEED